MLWLAELLRLLRRLLARKETAEFSANSAIERTSRVTDV